MKFQQMDVYGAAIELVGLTRSLVLRLRRSDPVLGDQLHRSVISIPLNVAEGAGEFSPADKARFYRYALRSCTEALAILDVCRTIGLTTPADQPAYDMGERVIAMLTRLVASVIDRASPQRTVGRPDRRPPDKPRHLETGRGPS